MWWHLNREIWQNNDEPWDAMVSYFQTKPHEISSPHLCRLGLFSWTELNLVTRPLPVVSAKISFCDLAPALHKAAGCLRNTAFRKWLCWISLKDIDNGRAHLQDHEAMASNDKGCSQNKWWSSVAIWITITAVSIKSNWGHPSYQTSFSSAGLPSWGVLALEAVSAGRLPAVVALLCASSAAGTLCGALCLAVVPLLSTFAPIPQAASSKLTAWWLRCPQPKWARVLGVF